MLSPSTLSFIRAHAHDDVRRLALLAPRYPLVDMAEALRQIQGRQAAARKLPWLARREGVVYPPHLSMEQCSGEAAALYKMRVAARLLAPAGRGRMADLTGGFGVDFYALSRLFSEAIYVERSEELCATARHNLQALGARNASVVCADGAEYLRGMEAADLIYIDPARRTADGRRAYAIADCSPDVTALAPLMLEKSARVMVKLSPMLDHREAARLLPSVSEIHIVSERGECKETLLCLQRGHTGAPTLYCRVGRRTLLAGGETGTEAPLAPMPAAPCYLYDPDAALMKAGAWTWLCREYGVEMVGRQAHLFVSRERAAGFPGRCFRMTGMTTMNRKDLRHALAGTERASIAVRDFPLTVDALRHRLRLADGGSLHIFGTTLADGSHRLLLCERVWER